MASSTRSPSRSRTEALRGTANRPALLALVAGFLALAVATVAGAAGPLVADIATPPALARALLAAVAIVLGLRLLVMALRRIDSAARPAGEEAGADIGSMVRGVRYVFLAAAAFAASAGWLIGHPLPIVIALVIAGIDVVETSLLLLVAGARPAHRARE